MNLFYAPLLTVQRIFPSVIYMIHSDIGKKSIHNPLANPVYTLSIKSTIFVCIFVFQQDTGIPGIPGMPADFMRAFEGMNMGDIGGGSGDADLVPMMQGIMQNLLCKEVLYPSLKEVVGKVSAQLYSIEPTLCSDISVYFSCRSCTLPFCAGVFIHTIKVLFYFGCVSYTH